MRTTIKTITTSLLFYLTLFGGTHLHAESTSTLLHDINATFSQYDLDVLHNVDAIMSLSPQAIDSNATLKHAFEAYQKLLPRFLKSPSIFPASLFGEDHAQGIAVSMQYRDFFYLSLLDIRLSMQRGDEAEAVKILNASLKNLEALMTHSNSMLDYILGSVLYADAFKQLHGFQKDDRLCRCLADNRPPKETEFFRVLAAEKAWLFKLTDTTLCRQKDFDRHGPGYEQLMRNVARRMKFYYNRYEQKYIEALTSDAPEKLDQFERYMRHETEELTGIWGKWGFVYEGMKVKLLSRFGFDADTGGIADYMGRMNALVAFPRSAGAYREHRQMLRQYRTLMRACHNE